MRQANHMMQFDDEYVYPVANISGIIPRYYPNTITEQLKLSCKCELCVTVGNSKFHFCIIQGKYRVPFTISFPQTKPWMIS
jgi:hypothetical protein